MPKQGSLLPALTEKQHLRLLDALMEVRGQLAEATEAEKKRSGAAKEKIALFQKRFDQILRDLAQEQEEEKS